MQSARRRSALAAGALQRSGIESIAGLRADSVRRHATYASPVELNAAIDRSNALQEELWQQVKEVAVKDNAVVPTGLYIQALNQMIDNQEKRLTASRNRAPGIVLLA